VLVEERFPRSCVPSRCLAVDHLRPADCGAHRRRARPVDHPDYFAVPVVARRILFRSGRRLAACPRFKANSGNKGKVMNTVVWRYSTAPAHYLRMATNGGLLSSSHWRPAVGGRSLAHHHDDAVGACLRCCPFGENPQRRTTGYKEYIREHQRLYSVGSARKRTAKRARGHSTAFTPK